jgi:hypothetical protein
MVVSAIEHEVQDAGGFLGKLRGQLLVILLRRERTIEGNHYGPVKHEPGEVFDPSALDRASSAARSLEISGPILLLTEVFN